MDDPKIDRTTLSDEDERLVDAHMGTGDYSSRQDVVRMALSRLNTPPPTLEQCTELIEANSMNWTPEALRTALTRGLNSGPAEPWDREAFLRRARERHAERKNG